MKKIEGKNIFYESKIDKLKYIKKTNKIPPKEFREDYKSHGEILRQQLIKLKNETFNEGKVNLKKGMYIDFISEKDSKLEIKSLKNDREKIELLNVKNVVKDEKEYEKATVFIPENKKDYFNKKIEAYISSQKNKGLFEKIEKIESATIESFWIGDLSELPSLEKVWCEVWLKNKEENEKEKKYIKQIKELKIELKEKPLIFEERIIFLCKINRKDIVNLLTNINEICEIKLNYGLTSFYLDDINRAEQFEVISELEERLIIEDEKKASILILDSGINNEHPLIKEFLKEEDCKAYNENDKNDNIGHGTRMAGLAIYGDLQKVIESKKSKKICHELQSYKICYEENKEESLYGSITNEAILFSKDLKGQINCMAVSSVDKTLSEGGYPSSWSSSIDKLIYGDELRKEGRMFCLSTGNIRIDEAKDYPNVNDVSHIEDPGQSWNALTVGAYTEKYMEGKELVAPPHSLSPYSKTSIIWNNDMKLIKPEVLFEGGNLYKDEYGICQPDDLSLLTTNSKFDKEIFTSFQATSAATALAANFCAQIQATYPDIWPQTLRGLVIHSADWSEKMKSDFLPKNKNKIPKKDYGNMLRRCGYGIPNLSKALGLLKNSVNLIIQEEIKPYKLNSKENDIIFNELHIHEIPWPKDLFEKLSDKKFEVKITLSYFIEPNPKLSRGIYDYQSYGLRFALSGNRNKDELRRKVTKIEGEENQSDEFQENWLYGVNNRNTGSVHVDIWNGSGAEFMENNYIAVYPVTGWWKQIKKGDNHLQNVRYSLIVSITSEDEKIDLFTPIYQNIEIENRIKTKIKI